MCLCVHPGAPKEWNPFYILYIFPLGDLEREGECGRGGLGLLWAVGGSAGLAAWNPGSRPGI